MDESRNENTWKTAPELQGTPIVDTLPLRQTIEIDVLFFMHARCHVFAFEHARAKESPTHHFGPQPVPTLPLSLLFATISRPPTLLFPLSISCLIHLMLRFDRGSPQSREASKLSQATDSPSFEIDSFSSSTPSP